MVGRLLSFVLAGALWPAVLLAETGKLSARFIGNAAFEITDGEFTLLTDFPYQSGAFGYMTYDPAEVARRLHVTRGGLRARRRDDISPAGPGPRGR